ncbi:MAG: crossover junction endodeoxyribonuclease RuvC [Planctomycetota bacterium]
MSDSLPGRSPQVILGIDPGTMVLGYGAIALHGRQPVLLAAGTVRASKHMGPSQRLGRIRQGLDEVIGQLQPHIVVVERVFASENVASALRIGEARGVASSSAACPAPGRCSSSPRQEVRRP